MPWRKLLAAAAACAVAAAIAVPLIESGKERGREREERTAAALEAARQERLERDQRAHRARARHPRDAADASRALIAALERSITRDARARAARGELDSPVRRTSCEPAADASPAGSRRGKEPYDCIAVIRRFSGVKSGTAGYPFRAVVDFVDYSYVWCKTNPVPGEHGVPDPRDVVELPRECVG